VPRETLLISAPPNPFAFRSMGTGGWGSKSSFRCEMLAEHLLSTPMRRGYQVMLSLEEGCSVCLPTGRACAWGGYSNAVANEEVTGLPSSRMPRRTGALSPSVVCAGLHCVCVCVLWFLIATLHYDRGLVRSRCTRISTRLLDATCRARVRVDDATAQRLFLLLSSRTSMRKQPLQYNIITAATLQTTIPEDPISAATTSSTINNHQSS